MINQRGSGAKGAAPLFTSEQPPLVGEQTDDRGKLRSRWGATVVCLMSTCLHYLAEVWSPGNHP